MLKETIAVQGDEQGRAVLNEIAALLQNLLDRGEVGSIDLGLLSLTDEDHALLEEVLGEGEVRADVEALGVTEVAESGVPGVWWVTHYDADEEIIAEFIEVAHCPEILLSPREEIRSGLNALRARLLEEHLINKGEENG